MSYLPVFTSVAESVRKVAIVGTGPSVKGIDFDFGKSVAVIAVNDAINFLPRSDFWFTLDPSKSNIAHMENQIAGVTYYCAVPKDYKSAIPGIRYLERVTGDGHGRYRTKSGLSRDKATINTGNSAWGALQLAVHMDPELIVLFGIDGFGEYAYDVKGRKPGELRMMPELFSSAVPDLVTLKIQVLNGSPKSAVTCFHRLPQKEAMARINQW